MLGGNASGTVRTASMALNSFASPQSLVVDAPIDDAGKPLSGWLAQILRALLTCGVACVSHTEIGFRAAPRGAMASATWDCGGENGLACM